MKNLEAYSLLSMMARNALISREGIDPEKQRKLYQMNSLQLGYIVDLASALEMPEDYEDIAFIKNAEKEFKKYRSPMSIQEAEAKLSSL